MRLVTLSVIFVISLSCKTLDESGTSKDENIEISEPADTKVTYQESECGVLVKTRPLSESEKAIFEKNWRLVDDLTTKHKVVIDGRNDFFIYGFNIENLNYNSRKFFFKSKASGKPYNKEDHTEGSFGFESIAISNVITEGTETPFQVLIFKGIRSYFDEFDCIVTGLLDASSVSERLTMFSWLARKKEFVESIKKSAAGITPIELKKSSTSREYEIETHL